MINSEQRENFKKYISEGLEVSISLRGSRGNSDLISGKVSEILTKSDFHPYGIMVKLSGGEIGRIQAISANNHTDKPRGSGVGVLSIEEMISGGETHYVEFKASALWSTNYTDDQIHSNPSRELKKYGRAASKYIIAKTMSAFLNSEGGCLAIGIKEDKERGTNFVIGIESEFSKLTDKNVDGYRRMLVDEILKKYLPTHITNHMPNYINMEFPKIDGKLLCCLRMVKSDRAVFIRVQDNELFFIKLDAETKELYKREELVDYCQRRFNK